MRHSIKTITLIASLTCCLPIVQAETLRFPITQFLIQGNSLLPVETLVQLTRPYTGESRVYGDIQKALESIENAYRKAGYGAVRVYVPEQDISTGFVQINIVETKLNNIVSELTTHFDRDNILASLPTLQQGKSPNTSKISDNVQLVNENPAKKVEVVMGIGETENTIDATVKVREENPVSVMLTADNSGNASTGQSRIGATLTHANLFNRDQVAALSYLTAAEKPDAVQIMSLGYHVPIFSWNDSFDLAIGYSNVSAGATSIPSGMLGFSGRGMVSSIRYNHNLARKGEYSHKIITSLEQKDYDNSCSINGMSDACGSAGEDISVQPITIGYAGTWLKPGLMADFNFGISSNIGGSSVEQFNKVLPNREAVRSYQIQRFGVNILSTFGQSDWQWRLAMQAQNSESALIPGEQIGLAGANSLRSLGERQLAADTGRALTTEVYTPDLSHWLGTNRGNLRLLAFVDSVNGQNNHATGATLSSLAATSIGLGARYNYARDWVVRFDVGNLQQISAKDANQNNVTALTSLTGDTRLHASLLVKF
jgi:hemolysin activation/secretion protein